jgi:hypothetical protein
VLGNVVALAFLLVCALALWALVSSLINEWRSGAAFFRYRNWKGMLVSHADVLILIVVAGIAMILGVVWTWWDRGREKRFARRIAKDRRAG